MMEYRKEWTTMRVTWLALAAVVIMAAVVVGTWQLAYGRGRDEGQATVLASRDAFIQGRPGGTGPVARVRAPGGGATDGQVGLAEPVEGTIERIDGQQATVRTSDGPVTVTLKEQTTLRRVEPLEAGQLKVGDKVVVVGQKGNDGSVAADGLEVHD